MADTVGAAWATAHFDEAPADGMGRKNESSQHSSLGVRPSAFALPVESLRISEEAAGLLQELGIETVEQLKTLPREGLALRFGEKLLLRLDQLTGAGREVIEPRRSLGPLEASYVLEEPTADWAVLRFVFEQLVEQLARQLIARNQGAVLLVGSFGFAGETPQQFQVGLLQPSASTRQLLELIELHLERLKLRNEVDRVELRAAVVGNLGERQGELFADCWPIDPHQLAVLVNRLGSRLGSESVLRAEPRASPVPERAVKWAAIVGQNDRALKQENKKTRSRSPSSPGFLPARPLVLCSKPQKIEVGCIAPAGPPQFVWLEKRREQVVESVGPERIETLWWRGPAVRRDYYRVTTEAGRQLWIFERLTDHEWFLQGIFE
jgi:protein ImuB